MFIIVTFAVDGVGVRVHGLRAQESVNQVLVWWNMMAVFRWCRHYLDSCSQLLVLISCCAVRMKHGYEIRDSDMQRCSVLLCVINDVFRVCIRLTAAVATVASCVGRVRRQCIVAPLHSKYAVFVVAVTLIFGISQYPSPFE
jgi:hypothetical protein